ncbi:MAG: hypothetical protein HY664_08710 [Chloroflexi bacterium]|nr:hypothetical protein [Chloroflexota bacterium]
MSTDIANSSEAIIQSFRESIISGKHWYIALLEAIGSWDIAEEARNGHKNRYLIANEALDWPLIADRLCQAVDGLIPQEEKETLTQGVAPIDLPEPEIQKLMGIAKYQAYLNYFYGVTVEEALVLTVAEELKKERGPFKSHNLIDESCRRIYGAPREELLARFQIETGLPPCEEKEFTYWLFRYRLRNGPKALVASDTKKALKRWRDSRLRAISRHPTLCDEPADIIDI